MVTILTEGCDQVPGKCDQAFVVTHPARMVTFFVCLVTKLFTKAGVDLCLDLWLSVRVFRITPGGYAHVFHNLAKAGIIEISASCRIREVMEGKNGNGQ